MNSARTIKYKITGNHSGRPVLNVDLSQLRFVNQREIHINGKPKSRSCHLFHFAILEIPQK